MPLQNRVDPFGAFHAMPARGGLMGNRGILHDGDQVPRRTHAHRNWVTCRLQFKHRKRTLMAPHRYTELFFLDEATAFAAGHRPCAECRRERYTSFAAAWREVHGAPPEGLPQGQAIDRALHPARIARGGGKVSYRADSASLPDGTIFAHAGGAVLTWQGQHFAWGFDGYRPITAIGGPVQVLTPKPIVDLFASGWRPDVAL
ncbi:MAG: hypothetical protein K8F59_11255 [Rhodobacteraceae bacterium]|nr:hypothetical protein [Paracoccaceae bacterium]